MKFACNPVNIADINTMTPTPMAIPARMNIVCILPSRINRTAAIHSNGNQRVTRVSPARAGPP